MSPGNRLQRQSRHSYDLLKVYLSNEESDREAVWARRLSANTAEILNLPVLAGRYKYRDVVEFHPDSLQALRVFQDGGYRPTRLVEYQGDVREAKEAWQHRGYVVEALVPGTLGITRKRGAIAKR